MGGEKWLSATRIIKLLINLHVSMCPPCFHQLSVRVRKNKAKISSPLGSLVQIIVDIDTMSNAKANMSFGSRVFGVFYCKMA